MRRAARTDGNHAEIVKALKQVGATVQDLSRIGDGCPDILAGFRGQNVLMEIKPGGNVEKHQRELRPNQVEWHAQWRGQVVKVASVDEAIAALNSKEIAYERV